IQSPLTPTGLERGAPRTDWAKMAAGVSFLADEGCMIEQCPVEVLDMTPWDRLTCKVRHCPDQGFRIMSSQSKVASEKPDDIGVYDGVAFAEGKAANSCRSVLPNSWQPQQLIPLPRHPSAVSCQQLLR